METRVWSWDDFEYVWDSARSVWGWWSEFWDG